MTSSRSGTGVYFWPYDIFGYLLPGAIALLPLTQFHRDIRGLVISRFQPDNWVDVIVLAIACYITGHVIAALSSWSLERILLKYTFGYPVTQMFSGYKDGPYLRRCLGRLTDAYKLPCVANLRRQRLRWLYDCVRSVCLTTRSVLDLIPGFVHPFDNKYRAAIEDQFRRISGVTHADWSRSRRAHDMFWTVHTFVMQRMPTVYQSSMHFVELYGFSRNASLAFLVAALYPICPHWEPTINGTNVFSAEVWSCGCALASFAMYVNFVKLLRRHNDLILRAFVANGQWASMQSSSDE